MRRCRLPTATGTATARTTATVGASVLLLAASSAAFAEPARTLCYAGSQHAKVGAIEKTVKVVVERTLDPAASEVRQRSWSEQDPSRVVELKASINAKANTFEFDDAELGAHGTGTLEGKAWHWTGMKMTVTKGPLKIASATQVSDTRIHQQADMSTDGKPIGTVTGDLTAFDCKSLDAKRSALGGSASPSPAPAKPSTPAK